MKFPSCFIFPKYKESFSHLHAPVLTCHGTGLHWETGEFYRTQTVALWKSAPLYPENQCELSFDAKQAFVLVHHLKFDTS